MNRATFKIAVTLVYDLPFPADILLSIEVAQLPDQILVRDLLTVSGAGPLTTILGEDDIGRRTWVCAKERLTINYDAEVCIQRDITPIDTLIVERRTKLTESVIHYVWPSRYCEADRFTAFVSREFADVEGGAKLRAMADWIHSHIEYRPGTSDSATTAVDTFVSRQGVCRDFAHLMAAFARAADIPARVVSVYAFGLKSQDFHAVVEVWLEGAWHFVDTTRLASPENLIRVAVGRDATDVSFMTIFGTAMLVDQSVSVTRVDV